MKKTILIIIFALITTPIFTQEANIAIIYPFDKYNNVETTHEIYLQSKLTKIIIQKEGYKAFTRTDINAIIDEHRFQETGMVNDDERQKIGEMTGATHICISNFIYKDSDMIITAQIINIETGEIIVSEIHTLKKEKVEFKYINRACNSIAGQVNNNIPYIPIIPTILTYNNTNEAINYINERILKESITIDTEEQIWISGSIKFKISKILFSYNNNMIKHYVRISCKKYNCIETSYGKLQTTSLECRTKKDAEDTIKAFQFIQSQY